MVSVREVAAVRQVQTENSIAGLQDGGVSLHIGLRSGVGLDVGVFRSEKLFRAITGQVLDDVGKLAAAVIAFTRIALGVFIRKHRAHCFKHGLADKVFRGDEFQSFMLAANLIIDGSGHFGICFEQRARHVVVFHLNLRENLAFHRRCAHKRPGDEAPCSFEASSEARTQALSIAREHPG